MIFGGRAAACHLFVVGPEISDYLCAVMKTASSIRSQVLRYGLGIVGLFFVALGIALSVVSNLGTSPLSCLPYVLTGTGHLTVGSWTVCVNMTYMLVQILLLRRQFTLKYLMQVPATLMLGLLIDVCMWCIRWICPTGFVFKTGLCLISCLVSAFGVSLEVAARRLMLSAETTVYALCKKIPQPFRRLKVAMDSTMVAVAALLAWAVFGNPFGITPFESLSAWLAGGSAGTVIGVGTLITAVLTGSLMRLTDPLAAAILHRLRVE